MGAFTKKRLQKYLDLCQEIDNQQERLERMISAMTSPSSAPLDDMPRGSSDTDRMASSIERKEALEKKIAELREQEADEYWLIDAAIKRVELANQRLVLRSRYLDRCSWDEVCAALFGDRSDYNDKFENYERTTYRIHGNALESLSQSGGKIETKKQP